MGHGLDGLDTDFADFCFANQVLVFGKNAKKDPFQSEKSVSSAFHPSNSAKIRV